MKKISYLIISMLMTAAVFAQQSDNTVSVVFSDTSAVVNVADNIAQYLTTTVNGAHVSIVQSDSVAKEITYKLSGSSTDGEFYMSGSYKSTIELNGLSLTNTTPVFSGAAIHIQNGKRINIKVITGTTNTLVDAAGGNQKGCLYVKGHAEFKQAGTLNVVGNVKHGIKAGEYITVKEASINVTSAVGDGISCNEYFLMESGTININGTSDDGIQCDLDGTASTGETDDHDDEDSGNIYITGGTITINCTADAAKGIKGEGDMNISGGTITVVTSGKGTWDSDDKETKAASGMSCDGNMNISGGTLNLTSTGSGGKGMKCDGVLTITDGSITAATLGNLYYNDGKTENTNYTGNTDRVSSDYYSSPKGIKAGLKIQNDSTNTYTYSGGMFISGGYIKVTTGGRNGEGIESKNMLEISGGEIFVNAYDDAINSAQDLTISGGYVYAHSTNNDGTDANGNSYVNGGLVYAIGARSPEVALDANTEEGKRLYINGGILIAVGGLEMGSAISQACYQTSSVSSDSWYAMTYGNNVIAFYVPTISTGGPGGGPGGPGGPGGGNSGKLVVSAPSTPTLKNKVTVIDGTSIFEDNCYLDANTNGGSSVSLTYIGGTVGIDEINNDGIIVYFNQGRIIVDGADESSVQVFDLEGRQVHNNNLHNGVYFVKVGSYTTYKVIVMQ
ncbi:MAG: carbohydrate-binding domain-containing protein [Bacteroidetes bacterium]|nr:carbohydrate-binding domain-containing protein [Bacteroidota bacterium]